MINNVMCNVGIYKITSPTNRIYIGQSLNIDNRFRNYKCLSKAIKKQPKFYASLLKYGWDNHIAQIVHELPIDISKNVIDEYEKFYIEQYRYCWFDLMNIKEGARSEEHRKNISLAHIGKKCPLLSRKVICNKTGVIYNSIGEAAKEFGLKYSTLSSYLNGSKKNKSTLNYYNNV